jgi:hypothetical protein
MMVILMLTMMMMMMMMMMMTLLLLLMSWQVGQFLPPKYEITVEYPFMPHPQVRPHQRAFHNTDGLFSDGFTHGMMPCCRVAMLRPHQRASHRRLGSACIMLSCSIDPRSTG